MRRVVVTGLGAVTPLGVGVRSTWKRLIAAESGLVSVADRSPKWKDLTSTVAGIVPVAKGDRFSNHEIWRASDYLSSSDQRRMSTFSQYAIAASEMALKDSGWEPKTEAQLDATGVCLGSGIGNLHDLYETSITFHEDVCRLLFLFSRRRKICC